MNWQFDSSLTCSTEMIDTVDIVVDVADLFEDHYRYVPKAKVKLNVSFLLGMGHPRDHSNRGAVFQLTRTTEA